MEQEEWQKALKLLWKMSEEQAESFLEAVTDHQEYLQLDKAKKDGKILLEVLKDGKYVTVAEQDYVKGEEV